MGWKSGVILGDIIIHGLDGLASHRYKCIAEDNIV